MVSGQSDHSIYHNDWCHYGNPLTYRWPITLAPSVYPDAMVHFLVDILVYITLQSSYVCLGIRRRRHAKAYILIFMLSVVICCMLVQYSHDYCLGKYSCMCQHFSPLYRGESRFFYMQDCCRRQCTEVRSGDQSVRSMEKKLRLYFSVIRMGSRGTFVLCTASSRCKRIAGHGAAMCLRFLLKFHSRNVIRTFTQRNTYVHVNVLDRSLVPKPFDFSQELQCNGS